MRTGNPPYASILPKRSAVVVSCSLVRRLARYLARSLFLCSASALPDLTIVRCGLVHVELFSLFSLEPINEHSFFFHGLSPIEPITCYNKQSNRMCEERSYG